MCQDEGHEFVAAGTAEAGAEVQQRVRVEAVHVRQPVDRDHPLHRVAAASQVVGGA
jgi:hypothetical protein